MTEPNIPGDQSEKESPPSQIIITFTAGPHTTGLSMATSYVDTAQIELAGDFLKRYAEEQYKIATAMEQSKRLVPAPTGFRV